MSLVITTSITGWFCEYSKLLYTTSTVRRLVVLGRSYKSQALWTGFGKTLQVFWDQLLKIKVLHSLRTSGNTPQLSASHPTRPESLTILLFQLQISQVYRILKSLCFLWRLISCFTMQYIVWHNVNVHFKATIDKNNYGKSTSIYTHM